MADGLARTGDGLGAPGNVARPAGARRGRSRRDRPTGDAGAAAPCGGSGSLIPARWADPERRGHLVEGARRRDSLREMHERGRITDPQWAAAERLRSDWSLAMSQGLRNMRWDGASGGGGGGGWLPGDALLAARGRLREVAARLGRLEAMMESVLLLNLSLTMTAKRLRQAKSATADDLRRGLDILADYYLFSMGNRVGSSMLHRSIAFGA